MKITIKKRGNKRTLKKHKNMRKRTKNYRKKNGGMFSRVAQGFAKRTIEPHIERKTKELGTDLIEANIKNSDMYKYTKNKIESGLLRSANFVDENTNPNSSEYKPMKGLTGLTITPQMLAIKPPVSIETTKAVYRGISPQFTNNNYIKQNI